MEWWKCLRCRCSSRCRWGPGHHQALWLPPDHRWMHLLAAASEEGVNFVFHHSLGWLVVDQVPSVFPEFSHNFLYYHKFVITERTLKLVKVVQHFLHLFVRDLWNKCLGLGQWPFLAGLTSYLRKHVSFGQVKGKDKVSGECLWKCAVEEEYVIEFLYFDGVDITVGESPHVYSRLAKGWFLPVGIPEHVTETEESQDLTILKYIGTVLRLTIQYIIRYRFCILQFS